MFLGLVWPPFYQFLVDKGENGSIPHHSQATWNMSISLDAGRVSPSSSPVGHHSPTGACIRFDLRWLDLLCIAFSRTSSAFISHSNPRISDDYPISSSWIHHANNQPEGAVASIRMSELFFIPILLHVPTAICLHVLRLLNFIHHASNPSRQLPCPIVVQRCHPKGLVQIILPSKTLYLCRPVWNNIAASCPSSRPPYLLPVILKLSNALPSLLS